MCNFAGGAEVLSLGISQAAACALRQDRHGEWEECCKPQTPLQKHACSA